MTTLSLKAVLHQKIAQIEGVDLLVALQMMIDDSLPQSKQAIPSNSKKRKFGFGKGTFIDIADDFDAQLEDFKEYM